MRILFVADGRSPIALNWIGYFARNGHDIHLATTFPAHPDIPLSSIHTILVAFSGARGRPGGSAQGKKKGIWSASFLPLRTALRQWLGPLTFPDAARRLRQVIDQVQPDLIHAMRVPYEGMIAALAQEGARTQSVPLLISIWGNDFTLHAPSTPWMGFYTRLAMQRASGLHTDCARDQRIAAAWGFPEGRPSIVLPGAGGIQLDIFTPGTPEERKRDECIVVNPRGFRAYVRNDTFFRSISLVSAKQPHIRFLCPGMAGEAQALHWMEESGISSLVDLLPQVPRSQMASIFRRAQVAVSPSVHDGTPNTLLEAMACGCLPVAGDLESIREWITPGLNGLLFDPADPQALADAILLGLERSDLRERAARINLGLIEDRAEHGRVMAKAEGFYKCLI